MTESDYTQDLLKELRWGSKDKWLVLKHADHLTLGVPDISITSAKKGTWVEVKRVQSRSTEFFNLDGLKNDPQGTNMWRLGKLGIAHYVMYLELGKDRYTTIWPPDKVQANLDVPRIMLTDFYSVSRPDTDGTLIFPSEVYAVLQGSPSTVLIIEDIVHPVVRAVQEYLHDN